MTIPTREACQMCHHARGLGFWVPNEMWEEVVHKHWRHSPLCITCFAQLADEQLVAWDKEIVFMPVSSVTHFASLGIDTRSVYQ